MVVQPPQTSMLSINYIVAPPTLSAQLSWASCASSKAYEGTLHLLFYIVIFMCCGHPASFWLETYPYLAFSVVTCRIVQKGHFLAFHNFQDLDFDLVLTLSLCPIFNANLISFAHKNNSMSDEPDILKFLFGLFSQKGLGFELSGGAETGW